MKQLFSRRMLCMCCAALALSAMQPTLAEEKRGLNGSWGGAQNGLTAQVIIVGVKVIGFYWRGDYLDAQSAKFSSNGDKLGFSFPGGTAVLTRASEGVATIDVNEGGNVTRLNLRRD
jgi:hypothetical protein